MNSEEKAKHIEQLEKMLHGLSKLSLGTDQSSLLTGLKDCLDSREFERKEKEIYSLIQKQLLSLARKHEIFTVNCEQFFSYENSEELLTIIALFQKTLSEYKPNNPLSSDNLTIEYHKIQQLKEHFAKEMERSRQSSFDLRSFNSIKNDVVIAALLNNLFRISQNAEETINKTNHYIKYYEPQEGYIEYLTRRLQEGIRRLTKINEEKKVSTEALLERQNLLSPTENALDPSFNQAKITLVTCLEKWLAKFSMLHFANENAKETSVVKEMLVNYSEALCKELKASYLPIKKETIEKIRIALLQHLGQKTSFFSFKPIIKKLTTEEIAILVTDILDADPVNSTEKRKQIESIYNFSAKIETELFDNILAYQELMPAVEILRKELHGKEKNLKTMTTCIKELQACYQLFPNSYQLINRNNLNSDIKNQEMNLQKINNEFLINEEIVHLLEATKEAMQDDLKVIENLSLAFTHLKNNLDLEITSLKEHYRKQKQQFKQLVKETLAHAEAAVSSTGEEKEFHNDFYQKVMDSSRQLLIKLAHTETENLGTLECEKNSSISKLENLIQDVKKHLKKKYSHYNELKFPAEEKNFPVLSEANVFKEDLRAQIDKTTKAILLSKAIYNELDTLSGKEFSAWLIKLKEAYLHALKEQENLNNLIEKAKIIEARLNSRSYHCSLHILIQLKTEFFRILHRHIPKEQLKQLSDNINSTELNFSDEFLNKIDERLLILSKIYHSFIKINKHFIGKNIDIYNDSTYLHALIEKVKEYLHNSKMENFSNATRYALVQWIRINILKSLVLLQNQINTYIKQIERRQNYLNLTPGACKTEVLLVNLGNETYLELEEIRASLS